MRILKSDNFRYGLLQGLYWSMFCTWFSFAVKLFDSFGYTKTQIGIIVALGTAATAVAQPMWGRICDRLRKIKGVFLFALVFGAAASLFMMFGRISPVFSGIGMILTAASTQSMLYIIDAWAVRLRQDGARISFGLTRSLGSFGYAFTAAVYGSVLARTGTGIMVPVFIAMSAVVVASVLYIREPRPQQEASGEAEEHNSFGCAVRELLHNSRFMALLVSSFLVFIARTASYTFFLPRMQELGGDSGPYGLALFIMAMSEIPLLLLYSRLRVHLKNSVMIAVALFFHVLLIFCMGNMPSVALLVITQLLQGPAYGFYISSLSTYITEIVPRRSCFMAQTIIASANFGLAGIIGNSLGGIIADNAGIGTMMTWFCLLPAAGFVLFVAAGRLRKKTENA